MTLARKVVDDSLAQRVTFVRITVFLENNMKLSLRAKLTGLILALAVLITAAVTVGSYVQMRGQLLTRPLNRLFAV